MDLRGEGCVITEERSWVPACWRGFPGRGALRAVPVEVSGRPGVIFIRVNQVLVRFWVCLSRGLARAGLGRVSDRHWRFSARGDGGVLRWQGCSGAWIVLMLSLGLLCAEGSVPAGRRVWMAPVHGGQAREDGP